MRYRAAMSEQTTTVTVNWEAVRVLAIAVGVREAARRLGINEETAKKRCTREGWLETPEARQAHAKAIEGRSGRTMSVVPNMSPMHAMQQELQALGGQSKLSLARGVAKAAKTVEDTDGASILAMSGDVKNIAQTADLVHGWRDQPKPSAMRLEVLLTKPEVHVDAIEIQSEVVQDQWDDAGEAQSI